MNRRTWAIAWVGHSSVNIIPMEFLQSSALQVECRCCPFGSGRSTCSRAIQEDVASPLIWLGGRPSARLTCYQSRPMRCLHVTPPIQLSAVLQAAIVLRPPCRPILWSCQGAILPNIRATGIPFRKRNPPPGKEKFPKIPGKRPWAYLIPHTPTQ